MDARLRRLAAEKNDARLAIGAGQRKRCVRGRGEEEEDEEEAVRER